MKSKNTQTRYQLVQTYFINISTTNHRARAVRIHPSRAVFRKDEKFSEVPLHFRRKPKKNHHPTRAGKKRKSAVFLAPFTRARYKLRFIISLSLSLSREADNHRRRQQKRMLYAYLRHFIFMVSVVCFNEVEFRKGAAPQQIRL